MKFVSFGTSHWSVTSHQHAFIQGPVVIPTIEAWRRQVWLYQERRPARETGYDRHTAARLLQSLWKEKNECREHGPYRMLKGVMHLPFLWALFALAGTVSACAYLPNRDPLAISVAGIESLPGEGMEMRLAVKVRVQNPNDLPVEFTGAALTLDLNGRKLASGVMGESGTVPRYGEVVMVIPVTISAFDMARQVLGAANAPGQSDVHYRVRGKLEAGVFGTRRFSDEGMFQLERPVGPGS